MSVDAALRKNVEDQLERLIAQLEDIEGLRAELSVEEYESSKKDTVAQLEEFQQSLQSLSAGNLTLQSELDATRMAVRAAISQAFKTPEVCASRHWSAPSSLHPSPTWLNHIAALRQVIRLFASKQPAALRRRLAELDRDVRLGKLSVEECSAQASEILVALKKLGETLQPKEEAFLQQHKTETLSAFEEVHDTDGVKQLPSTK